MKPNNKVFHSLNFCFTFSKSKTLNETATYVNMSHVLKSAKNYVETMRGSYYEGPYKT